MTEQEWLQALDPGPMLEFLRGKVSDRKWRLFAVACCQRVWDLVDDERSRQAVEVAERYADGLASPEVLREAHELAQKAWQMPARTAAWDTSRQPAAVEDAASHAAWATPGRTRAGERQSQTELLRCMFGPLPFRRIAIGAAWLTWNDGTVVKLAQAIYDARAFDRMPILADALEESGCTDADILGHCRQPGEHVRGCWLVDLLLGKE